MTKIAQQCNAMSDPKPELQPCPFCGKPPEVITQGSFKKVMCENMECRIIIETINDPECSGVDLWNTRAPTEPAGCAECELDRVHIDRIRIMAERDSLRADVERLTRELAASERTADQLLTERDNAEEAMSQAYYLVTGNSPQWSNNFGYEQAHEDISETCDSLRAALAKAQAELAQYKSAPDQQSENTKPE